MITVGVAYIAYSPLCRGFLTNTLKSHADIPPNSMQSMRPRFQADVFEHNLQLAKALNAFAEEKGVSSAQLALGWVRKLGAIPIFSATKVERIEENVKEVELGEEDMSAIEKILSGREVKGGRYPAGHEKYLHA